MKRRVYRGFALLVCLSLALTGCANQLTVTSSPSGADLAVNGSPYGRTPVTVEKLEAGVYLLEVNAVGYEPWQTEIEVKGREAVNAILTPRSADRPDRAPQATREIRVVQETRLTVFAEPPVAEVFVDEIFHGHAGEGAPVIVSYQDAPTLALVEVRKAGYKTWRGKVVMHAERDNRIYVNLEPVAAWLDYTPDNELLRGTFGQIASEIPTLPGLRRTSKIAVVSMTNRSENDGPLPSMIKDVIIENLAQAGFTPSERDDDLLVHLAHTTVGDTLPYRILTKHDGTANPFVWDAELKTRDVKRTDHLTPTVTRTTEYEGCCGDEKASRIAVTEQNNITRLTHTEYNLRGAVPTADQFVAYRVLELGVARVPVREGASRPEPMITRRAKARLHVRIIDAKEGTVVWAGTLESQAGDEVPARVSDMLISPESRFVPEPLPEYLDRSLSTPDRTLTLTDPSIR